MCCGAFSLQLGIVQIVEWTTDGGQDAQTAALLMCLLDVPTMGIYPYCVLQDAFNKAEQKIYRFHADRGGA